MGRPEKPVDRTVPARAKLADFLRDRKTAVSLTHQQMSDLMNGSPSKATFERAASGASVPLWDTVEAFVEVTVTKEEELASSISLALARGQELWIRARRATRAPYYVHKAPDPSLISSTADLSRALRHQHVWAGCPTPGEMERMSGPGELPSSTTRRIIEGSTLPVDPTQAIAFLKACYVLAPVDLEPWLAATVQVFEKKSTTRYPGRWTSAHSKLLKEIQAASDEQSSPPLLRAA
ncbi:hypothetical protein OH809_44485 (plasmid) [Streptomyces sp. NBC_00873]|uniref:hypothetical protein n=1 Tax=unclassified Streptomyces TaxID=2593676 RepID=UPI002F917047|nr:hypothetical protein OH809_44485 [Streptomyces sp. NBC_00873]WTA49280.1 hypothetical protein OH821_44155 [Streptomyces sp. NBC_00842]